MTKTETYDDWAKSVFTKLPAEMKLLVVVDKLLTGFDARQELNRLPVRHEEWSH
jgi:type I site-specific restriction-modification system R (restriction) subunit